MVTGNGNEVDLKGNLHETIHVATKKISFVKVDFQLQKKTKGYTSGFFFR